jgi:hypothetical protein
VTLTVAQRTIVDQQQARRRRAAVTPIPRKTVRRFTVWCGSSIGRQYQTIEQLAARVLDLLPTGVWDELELLMKAGEGGTWQSAFDPHPLALSGSWTLANHIADARSIGVRITPYVVVRGRPAWLADEQAQIRACVTVAGRCVLNVEPGAPYYNGPNDPTYIRGYLRGIAVPADALEVCAIPRATQVAELGGVACIQAWTDPQFVGSASWETYDASAGVSGPTSLIPSEAIPRLDGWGVPPGPQYRICVVQQSRIGAWAETEWCRQGMAVWFVDGD